MSISEIQNAISKLSSEELARFRGWFDKYCAEVWDNQIEADAKSGRLDKIISQTNEEYDTGLENHS